MEQSLYIELILRTKNTLEFFKKFTQLAREKFSDKEFGEFFYRMIMREIEKNDILLDCFLSYIKATIPVIKVEVIRDTVNTLAGDILGKFRPFLEEKKIRVVKHLEKDLPETIVPDEQLRFILDVVFQYVMASLPPEGNIDFSTRSLTVQQGSSEDCARFRKNGKYIDITVAFSSGLKKQGVSSRKEPLPQSVHKKVQPDLLLRLVDDIVQRHRGIALFETDDSKEKKTISLKLPIDRRKISCYELPKE
jgi:hypothetical protein